MPLAARAIEPVYLGRRPLREEEQGEEVVQVAVTHNAVLGALVQLSGLVRHADDLFCDLADECQKVFEQTERIIHRVKRIKEKVGHLDSKAVSIPVGDLKQFNTVQDHHVAKHGFDCHFFTPDDRPHCVRCRYTLCEVTPARVLRGADPYRKDGLHSSDLFKLWPIVLKEHQPRSPDLSLYRKQGRPMTFNKKYKRLKARSRTLPNGDSVALFHQTRARQEEDGASLSSVDGALSRSQPSILVAVDTSGTGFRQMTSFRRSLKGTQSLDRKSSCRRRTVSGVPDSIMQEIEVFERGRRTTRNMPRNYSFDDLDSRKEPAAEKPDDAMKQYVEDMDAKMEEKAEEERANRDVKLLKFLPCRRSRSLPRCLKLKESRGGLTFEGESAKDKPMSTVSNGFASSLSIGSAGASSTTSSRTTRRSSIISSKLKSFVTNTLRPRPKSLDFDTVDILGNDADAEEDDEDDDSNSGRSKKLARVHSPSMPDNLSSLASSRESNVGPGTYYYFTSNTLPRAQARKYDFPWESLPKDWTTSVRLREISKRRREERNSSSGNWSGSSNRHSLDSEQSSAPPHTSHLSLGRDSGRDSFGEDREESHGEPGVSSFLPASPTSDTEQWLASLAQRAAAREDAVAAGSDVTQSLARLSELTKQNIQALEDTFSPRKPLDLRLDDEVSSVYSLDQDGFYTSFHTDSGLRRSTGTLIDEDDDGELTSSKETNNSFLSTESGNTMESVIFCPMGKVTPGKAGVQSGGGSKVRPKPPVRSGSRLSSRDTTPLDAGGDTLNTAGGSATNPTSPTDSDAFAELFSSDSDHETVSARLKVKTKISRRSIPSWCSISDEDSADSSNMCLTQGKPRDAASLSLSGSAPGKGTSQGSDGGGKDMAEDSWDLDSLPQRYLESKVWEEDLSDQSNSWPRSRRVQQPPTAGILKRDKSPAGSLKPKTLNFAPVVSMFDPLTARGVEMPLNAASSTSSSSSDTSTAGLAFTLSRCPPAAHSRLSRSLGDVKHSPSSVTPRNSAGLTPRVSQCKTSVQATSTPVSQARRQPEAKGGAADMSSESSVCSSESSLLSESDSWRSGRSLDHSSPGTLSSSSSAGLSDIDSSLTYVSMSGSNSTLVLEADDLMPAAALSDDLPTPVNSPVRTQAGNFPAFQDQQQAEGESLTPESVPAFQKSPSTSHQVSSLVLPVESPQGVARRQSLGSFAADASTEAAPVSWTREPTNVMISSADSGFSSSSSSAVCAKEQGHDPKQQREEHHHQRLSQSVSSPHHNIQGHTDCRNGPANKNWGDNTNSGSDKRYRSAHAADSRHKQYVEQKHEPPRTSQSHGECPQQPAPRSDSYRAATRDLNPFSHRPRDSAHSTTYSAHSTRDSAHSATYSAHSTTYSAHSTTYSAHSSAASKHRSHSSSHMVSPNPHKYMHTSMSCPKALVDDTEGVARADSYRLAVRNTQGVVGGEVPTRNTSYRMATGDEDTVPDARMDAINAWDRRQSIGNRDMRRVGITDIDQLKSYDSDSSTSRGSSSSRSGKSPSRGFASIRPSHKKMTPEVENLLRADKTPSPEVKLRTPRSSSCKDKDKAKRRSSTYIRFDSIFEKGDDMYSSSNTLRAESVEMIASEEGLLMGDKVVGQLPPGRVRVRAGGARRNSDEKATSSIFGSIKTTIKSMSGKSSDKDAWKYDGSN